MDKAKLKPCPHCGGSDVSFTSPEGPNEKVYDFVICGDCGATCNEVDTLPESDCVSVWNSRVPPQPPSASGEREAALLRLMPEVLASLKADGMNVSLVADLERAMAAPSPGIDAAGQNSSSNEAWLDHATATLFSVFHMAGDEPFVSAIKGCVVLHTLKTLERDLLENLDEYFTQGDGDYLFSGVWQHADPDVGAPSGYELELIRFTPLESAPPPAQPDAEWMAEAERLVDAYAKEFAQGGATYGRDIRRAALLAHLGTAATPEPGKARRRQRGRRGAGKPEAIPADDPRWKDGA